MGFPRPSLGLNHDRLSCSEIYSMQAPLLSFCVYNVWVFWVCSRLMPVCKQGFIPVFVGNTFSLICSRRPSRRTVILGPSKDVIKRFGVVNGHLIILGKR